VASAPRCYLALGDSFSAGIDAGSETPWPEAVANDLRRASPRLRFANLASVGATSQAVLDDQLPHAAGLQPDLVSLICGANDVLLSVRPDVDAFERRLDELVSRLDMLESRPLVVTATYPDLATFLPLRPRTAERVAAGLAAVNEAVRRVSSAHGAHCLEWAGHSGVADRENFADDDFHPSPIGHKRAAAAFAEGLSDKLPLGPDL